MIFTVMWLSYFKTHRKKKT